MTNQDLIQELRSEGFGRTTIHPGFIVGQRRRTPRYIVFDASERTVTLYDHYTLAPRLKPDDALIFEVEYIQTHDEGGILAVRSKLDQADDLAFISPKLEAILDALAKLWESKAL